MKPIILPAHFCHKLLNIENNIMFLFSTGISASNEIKNLYYHLNTFCFNNAFHISQYKSNVILDSFEVGKTKAVLDSIEVDLIFME